MKYTVQQGFTLIELLVSLSVMAVMTFMSWQGVDAMRETQHRLSQHNQDALTVQAGLNQWEIDLNHVYKHPFTATLAWNGKVVRIVRHTHDMKSLQVVAWSTRRINTVNTLLRWVSNPVTNVTALNQEWEHAERWSQSPTTLESEKQHETAIAPVSDIKIYYYWDDAWSNPLSSRNLAFKSIGEVFGNANDVLSYVPNAIRLVISVEPSMALSGNLTKDWVSSSVTGITE